MRCVSCLSCCYGKNTAVIKCSFYATGGELLGNREEVTTNSYAKKFLSIFCVAIIGTLCVERRPMSLVNDHLHSVGRQDECLCHALGALRLGWTLPIKDLGELAHNVLPLLRQPFLWLRRTYDIADSVHNTFRTHTESIQPRCFLCDVVECAGVFSLVFRTTVDWLFQKDNSVCSYFDERRVRLRNVFTFRDVHCIKALF